MLKLFIILTMLLAYCYCLESNDLLVSESRAKKKKSSGKLLALILLIVFSKVAIFKTVSVFLMMTFFQKLFSVGGMLLKHFMKSKPEKPSPTYGAPQPQKSPPNYDTVGYSYGPPEQETYQKEGYPGTDLASSIDWLLNKPMK